MAQRAAQKESLRRRFVEHARAFDAAFGAGPAPRCFFSPGRVNLMGAHLDYNGGPVMPTAIDRGTFLAVRPRTDRRLRLASCLEAGTFELDLDAAAATRRGAWVDYPIGVVEQLRDSLADVRGVDVLFGGNLPVGAGLSSSASICVGSAFAFDAAWGLGLSSLERVHAALRAEREFVGVHCGIMDPYAVGLAEPNHLLWLDCKDSTIRQIPVDTQRVAIGVADSGVRRELAQGAFNERVDQATAAFAVLREHSPRAGCLRDVPRSVLEARRASMDPLLARRAQHVIDEVERTFAARAALESGDLAGFGARMFEAHRSLRELYEVSCPELDELVDAAARCDGILGARLTGAGFGGCVVLLAESRARDAIAAQIGEQFEARFGRRPPIEWFGGDPGPREIDL